jgi:small GTP-binding protein
MKRNIDDLQFVKRSNEKSTFERKLFEITLLRTLPSKRRSFRMEECIVVLVGKCRVGKSSLRQTYISGTFPEEYIPEIYGYYQKWVVRKSTTVLLKISDTASSVDEDFIYTHLHTIPDIFLLCFSVIDPSTYAAIASFFVPKIRAKVGNGPMLLVGTKSDLRDSPQSDHRAISTRDGRKLASQIGAASYIECSAKTCRNADKVFNTALDILINPAPHFWNVNRVGIPSCSVC